MVNAIIGFIILLIGIAIVTGLNKSGNKVDNIKEELRDLAAETSNGLTGTIDKLNRKFNNWTDPKIDIYTAQKRLERTRTKYQIKRDGDKTLITAFDKSWSSYWSHKSGEFITVEYKNGRYVRWSFADAFDAGVEKERKESSGEKTLPDNIRDLYFSQEATEESNETSQCSIKDNDHNETIVQDTAKQITKPDRNSEIIHQTNLLDKSVTEYKKGLIDAFEITIAVTTFISFMWPHYSKQKQNDLFHALIEQLGIVFE